MVRHLRAARCFVRVRREANSALPTCGKHTQTLRARMGSERRMYDEQQRLIDKHRLSCLDITRSDQAYASPGYLDLRNRPHGSGSGGTHRNASYDGMHTRLNGSDHCRCNNLHAERRELGSAYED